MQGEGGCSNQSQVKSGESVFPFYVIFLSFSTFESLTESIFMKNYTTYFLSAH